MAIASAYPVLNRDLLAAGVLFHDCGKLWENQMPAEGFTMPYDEHGELLGHITIGIELVNNLWRKLQQAPEWAAWLPLDPACEDVRMHLLHLRDLGDSPCAHQHPAPRFVVIFVVHCDLPICLRVSSKSRG